MATLTQINDLREKAMRAITRARGIVEKSEGMISHAVQTVEVSGAAFGSGVVKGRYGAIEVLGMPVDFLGGAGMHLLGFMGGGKYAEHIHNLGDGLLASYFTDLGKGVGADWRASAARAAAQQGGGGAPVAAAGLPDGGLTDQELAILRQAGLRQGV